MTEDFFRIQQIVELQGLLADANARLARVEALADEPAIPYPAECQCAHGMGFQFHQYPCRYADNIPKASIRAALAAAPSREADQ